MRERWLRAGKEGMGAARACWWWWWWNGRGRGKGVGDVLGFVLIKLPPLRPFGFPFPFSFCMFSSSLACTL